MKHILWYEISKARKSAGPIARKAKRVKFFVLAILFLVVFSYSDKAEAVFSIELNYYSIDFGDMNMGDYKDDVPSNGLIVTCTTDSGQQWTLKIRDEWPLSHVSNPASVIPDTRFKWYGLTTSDSATNTSLVTTREDFTFEKNIYTGNAGEGANGTDITLKFELTLPPVLQSGTYATTVVFTFTE